MADFAEKRDETIANDALEQATAARSQLTEREKMLRGETTLYELLSMYKQDMMLMASTL